MASMTIEYASLEGTGASAGRAGSHVLIADRPQGKASGTGLGFNGGELLALSVGGCFCNDLHYTAEEMGLRIIRLKVRVTIELGGEPLVVNSAVVTRTANWRMDAALVGQQGDGARSARVMPKWLVSALGGKLPQGVSRIDAAGGD